MLDQPGHHIAPSGGAPMRSLISELLSEQSTATKRRRAATTPTASTAHGFEQHRVYRDVIDAMQNAEEMGGVASSEEYIQLLQAIARECEIRIATCADLNSIDMSKLPSGSLTMLEALRSIRDWPREFGDIQDYETMVANMQEVADQALKRKQ